MDERKKKMLRMQSRRFGLDEKKEKADMRKRFTRALKTKFYGLIEEGYLESSRGFYMLLMTDYMLDDDMEANPISSFEHAERMLESLSVRFLVSPWFEKARNNTWVRGPAKKLENSAMAMLYETSSSFIMAHRNAEKLMKERIHQGVDHQKDTWARIIDEICLESESNIQKMVNYFEKYRNFSPEIVEAIKVKAAVRVMLTLEREKVNETPISNVCFPNNDRVVYTTALWLLRLQIGELKKSGLMDDREVEKMTFTNNTSVVKLAAHPTSAKVPTKRDILRRMRPLYTVDMTEEQINLLAVSSNLKERNIQENQDLFTAGDAANCWYILVRGTIKDVSPNRKSWALKDQSINYPPLDCIGITDCLRGGEYTSTATATGFCVVYEFDVAKTKALMRDHTPIRTFVHMLCTEYIVKWKLSVFSSLRRLEAVHLVAAGTLCNFDKGTDQTEYFDENVLLLQGSASTEDESSLDMFSMYEYGDYRLGENSTVFLFPHLVEDEKTDGQYRVYRGTVRGSTRGTRSSDKSGIKGTSSRGTRSSGKSGIKRTSSQVKRTLSNKIK